MTLFFDASALVKRYCRELESSLVRRLILRGEGAMSRISEVEVASALYRRQREGGLGAGEARELVGRFERDLAELRVIEVTPAVTRMARILLARHALRAGDAIQLASSLHLQELLAAPVAFLCFDQRLAAAARDEGLAMR